MQSVCALFPAEFFRRIVDLRAELCEDPALGAIYDPPFVHMTLQLAEEYDWHGLESALVQVAQLHQPFDVRTVGVLAFTGKEAAIAIAPYKDEQLAKFHAAVWEASTEFASGRVDAFYEPGRWVPHITVKRCGTNDRSFGDAMRRLSKESFASTMPLDAIGVQHDPGKNSLTHYMRLRLPLGERDGAGETIPIKETNAAVVDVTEDPASDGAGGRLLRIRLDEGGQMDQRWTAPEVVRATAEAASSAVHFPNARCRFERDHITFIVPNTPHPTV